MNPRKRSIEIPSHYIRLKGDGWRGPTGFLPLWQPNEFGFPFDFLDDSLTPGRETIEATGTMRL
jgi:hypothetical protein